MALIERKSCLLKHKTMHISNFGANFNSLTVNSLQHLSSAGALLYLDRRGSKAAFTWQR